jgi:hypothetical protein
MLAPTMEIPIFDIFSSNVEQNIILLAQIVISSFLGDIFRRPQALCRWTDFSVFYGLPTDIINKVGGNVLGNKISAFALI